MTQSPKEIAGRDLQSPEQLRRELVEPCRPVVLRGLIADWPVVRAGLVSPRALRDYLGKFDAGSQLDVFFGDPKIAGKYYYAEDLKGFNFDKKRLRLGQALDAIIANLDRPGAPSVYAGSLPVDEYLPGFAAENAMALLPPQVGARIWLGHASNVSSHYDAFDNIACVIAGRRRFTLYAPELTSSLYIGPIDNTMAGQPVSLAASSPEDEAKYPLFRAVKDQALVAELDAGDALYLPKLWWHQVEGLASFNGLVNYWWDASSAGPDQPYAAMLLAMITIAERPPAERLAWRAYFDHYVFRPQGHPLAHLPPEQHGLLGPLKENYGKLRARVMHMLRGG
jgi:hypothetical protein